MRTVIIKGQDLVSFKNVLEQALSGQFGLITEIQAYVNEIGDGGLQLGTNGYTTQPFGVTLAEDVSQVIPVEAKAPEGSGNPYANVESEDLSDQDRIRLLETDIQWLKQVVSRAEGLLGVSLRGNTTHSSS